MRKVQSVASDVEMLYVDSVRTDNLLPMKTHREFVRRVNHAPALNFSWTHCDRTTKDTIHEYRAVDSGQWLECGLRCESLWIWNGVRCCVYVER